MEKQVINIDSTINLQPYFTQVVVSNLINAFFTAKLAQPEKTEEEVIERVMNLYTKVWEVFDKIPVKTHSPKKSEEKESKK